MKKLLLITTLLGLATTSFGKDFFNNVYIKAEFDSGAEYHTNDAPAPQGPKSGIEVAPRDLTTDGTGFNIALEGTRDINENLELGFGIAYQRHSKAFETLEVSGGGEGGGGASRMTASEPTLGTAREFYGKYDSIPVYLLGKYNFNNDSEWTPYVKAMLGWSLNDIGGTGTSQIYYDYNEFTPVSTAGYDDGLYYGIGLGVEHRDVFMEVMYQVNKGSMYTPGTESGLNNHVMGTDFDYSRVTFGIGIVL